MSLLNDIISLFSKKKGTNLSVTQLSLAYLETVRWKLMSNAMGKGREPQVFLPASELNNSKKIQQFSSKKNEHRTRTR